MSHRICQLSDQGRYPPRPLQNLMKRHELQQSRLGQPPPAAGLVPSMNPPRRVPHWQSTVQLCGAWIRATTLALEC